MPTRRKKNNDNIAATPEVKPQDCNPLATSVLREKCSFWELKNRDSLQVCKNCGNNITGKFCSECGQKTSTKRLRFGYTLHNFITAFFHVERGVFRTTWMLFSRPGYMARDYIEGKRRYYVNPFSLMVMLAGIYAVLYILMLWSQTGQTSRLDLILSSFEKTRHAQNDVNWPFLKDMYLAGRWLADSSIFLSLLMLPVYTLAIKLVFLRSNRRRYNYTELMYAGAFLASQRFIIDLFILPFQWIFWTGKLTHYLDVVYIVYIIFTVVTLKQLFGTGWFGAIMRTVAVVIISLFLLLIIILVVAGLISLVTGVREIMLDGETIHIINFE